VRVALAARQHPALVEVPSVETMVHRGGSMLLRHDAAAVHRDLIDATVPVVVAFAAANLAVGIEVHPTVHLPVEVQIERLTGDLVVRLHRRDVCNTVTIGVHAFGAGSIDVAVFMDNFSGTPTADVSGGARIA